MKGTREQTVKRLFVSFESEAQWSEVELLFNAGQKKSKPIKFQAYKVWSTTGIPAMFSGVRSSFESQRGAEMYFREQVEKYGGVVHESTPRLLARLKEEFSHGAA